MKTRDILAILFLVPVCASLSAAGRPHLYIHTGISRPAAGPDDFSQSYRTGVNFGVMAGKQVAGRLELTGSLAFHNFTFSKGHFTDTRQETNIDDFIVDGQPSHVITAFARAKWLMPVQKGGKTLSYFFAGPGLFYLNTRDVAGIGPTEAEDFIVAGRSETAFGFCGGLGFELAFEGTVLFLELGVAAGLTRGETTIFLPLKFGVAIK